MRASKIDVPQVRAVLEEIAFEFPGRTDRRAEDDLPARYLDQGQPNCLVALALIRLGFPITLLRELDRERPTGDLTRSGAQVAESRHPALKRIDHKALALLQYVQQRQDSGQCWDYIVEQAFKSTRSFTLKRFDERRRPWLY